MKLTLRYMKTYARSIACVIAMKLVSTICELLLPYIRDVANARRMLSEQAANFHGLQSGTIRIGTFTSVSSRLLPPVMKAFKEAHRAYNNDGDKNFRRKILVSEAKAAEMAKDYNRAVACWTDIIPTYDSQEEKSQINAAKRNVARLSAIARKNNKISMGSLDDDDSAETISLDE